MKSSFLNAQKDTHVLSDDLIPRKMYLWKSFTFTENN